MLTIFSLTSTHHFRIGTKIRRERVSKGKQLVHYEQREPRRWKYDKTLRYTVWKNEKVTLIWNIFREINSLVTSLVPRTHTYDVIFTECLQKKCESNILKIPHCVIHLCTYFLDRRLHTNLIILHPQQINNIFQKKILVLAFLQKFLNVFSESTYLSSSIVKLKATYRRLCFWVWYF